eukprot:TRINITY_DN3504_c0_g1_i1.p1 TRINITY_DN3504_c0_g1~~TRINITY_DN3504_c0_g1_i1.p1  ORF type:complete len:361 (+),score=7.51 TRINITY_DN3504_c0_g1_i1:60-1142(+)
MNYTNQTECEISTNFCNNFGDCVLDTKVGLYRCDCVTFWDPMYECRVSFFDEWFPFGFVYPGILLPICILMFVAYLAEIITDIKRGSYKNFKFYAKVLTIFYIIFRMVDTMIWITQLSLTKGTLLPGVPVSINISALLCATWGFCLVILSWVQVISKIEEFLKSNSYLLKMTRKGIFISLMIVSPSSLAFGIISVFVKPTISTTLLNLFLGVYCLILIIWTFYIIVKLHLHLSHQISFRGIGGMDVKQRAYTKNIALCISNIIFLMYITHIIIHTVLTFRASPIKYLISSVVLRVWEMILLFSFFFVTENYMFSSRAGGLGYLSVWRSDYSTNSNKTRTSVSKNQTYEKKDQDTTHNAVN